MPKGIALRANNRYEVPKNSMPGNFELKKKRLFLQELDEALRKRE